MPIIQKPSSSAGASTGIVQLPDTARLIDPTLLSASALSDLGFPDPSNLPDPFSYPDGMAVSLVNMGGTPTLVPTDQTSNIPQFIGFLSGAVLSSANRVPVLSIRGSKVTIFGEVGITFLTGQQLFLSEVVGRITNVPTTTSDKIITRVGFSFSDTEFIINNDSTATLY